MNFKEALIAHLQGEKAEVYSVFTAYDGDCGQWEWRDFGKYYANLELRNVHLRSYAEDIKYRLAPRTITINGVEIEAPIEPLPGDLCWSFNMQGHVTSYHYAPGIGQELADNGNAFRSREAARAAFEAVTKALKQKP